MDWSLNYAVMDLERQVDNIFKNQGWFTGLSGRVTA
jgi:hypothetical protein